MYVRARQTRLTAEKGILHPYCAQFHDQQSEIKWPAHKPLPAVKLAIRDDDKKCDAAPSRHAIHHNHNHTPPHACTAALNTHTTRPAVLPAGSCLATLRLTNQSCVLSVRSANMYRNALYEKIREDKDAINTRLKPRC